MKTKRLALISSLTITALIASPVLGAPQKKSVKTSQARSQRMASRTTQVTPAYRHGTNASFNSGTRQYAGTQRYGGRQYAGTRYYGQSRYADTGYSRGTRSYYGSRGYGYNYGASASPYYGYYSSWPSASYGYYPYGYYGGYPDSYSYYQPRAYSYYQPGYSNDDATVAAVQRRLGELGYYHGAVDGVIGPQTRGAVAA
jgi:hypothetical protein